MADRVTQATLPPTGDPPQDLRAVEIAVSYNQPPILRLSTDPMPRALVKDGQRMLVVNLGQMLVWWTNQWYPQPDLNASLTAFLLSSNTDELLRETRGVRLGLQRLLMHFDDDVDLLELAYAGDDEETT